MSREQQWVNGYVLHSRPFRETSVIAELFTRDHGRVSVVYRGVKSAKGKTAKGRLLQPFQPLSFLWFGDRELKTGKDFETSGAACFFSGTLLYSALYLNELLQRLLFREDPHPELYDQYCSTLQRLQGTSANDVPGIEILLRHFEWGMLTDLGYEIALDRDSDYRAIDPDLNYRYDADAGFLPTPRRVDPAQQQACFRGAELLAMAAQQWQEPGVLKAAKRLMRLALAPHLGDKPLKSRELFRKHPQSSAGGSPHTSDSHLQANQKSDYEQGDPIR